jgi:hypothetical protein
MRVDATAARIMAGAWITRIMRREYRVRRMTMEVRVVAVVIIRIPPPVVIPAIIWIIIVRIVPSEAYVASVRESYSEVNAGVPVAVVIAFVFVVVVIIVIIFYAASILRTIAVAVIRLCCFVDDAVGIDDGFCFFVGRFGFWTLCCTFTIICLIIILSVAAYFGCVECSIVGYNQFFVIFSVLVIRRIICVVFNDIIACRT